MEAGSPGRVAFIKENGCDGQLAKIERIIEVTYIISPVKKGKELLCSKLTFRLLESFMLRHECGRGIFGLLLSGSVCRPHSNDARAGLMFSLLALMLFTIDSLLSWKTEPAIRLHT